MLTASQHHSPEDSNLGFLHSTPADAGTLLLCDILLIIVISPTSICDLAILSCHQCNDCAFTFQLMKIEEGLLNGEVLFHEIIEKTDEERLLIQKKREEKRLDSREQLSQSEQLAAVLV